MANFVNNRIRLIGNKAIEQLSEEINRRFTKDYSENGCQSDNSIVGRVLYGYDDEEAYLQDEIEAKWAHLDGPMDDWEPLRLISGWKPLFEIQDHILWYAIKIDPKVIVYMEYDDEMPNFVGARYALFDDGQIQSFESEIDTSSFGVVSEDEVEKYTEENKKSNDFERIITWDDVWSLLHQQQSKAFEAMKKEHKWAKDNKRR
jgi:hypothetical protein